MDATKRPLLYTVLGVIALILAVFTGIPAILALGLTFAGGGILFIVLGLIALLVAGLYLVSGLGYIKMKTYMPKLVIVLFAFTVLNVVLNYVSSPEAFAWTNQIISLGISGGIAWKVNQDKALFKN